MQGGKLSDKIFNMSLLADMNLRIGTQLTTRDNYRCNKTNKKNAICSIFTTLKPEPVLLSNVRFYCKPKKKLKRRKPTSPGLAINRKMHYYHHYITFTAIARLITWFFSVFNYFFFAYDGPNRMKMNVIRVTFCLFLTFFLLLKTSGEQVMGKNWKK